ncbi:MAG: hypothetical protein ACOC4G_11185 [Bacillota bacterium]
MKNKVFIVKKSIFTEKKEEGFSSCLAVVLLLLILVAAMGGFIYFQWPKIKEYARSEIREIHNAIEQSDDIDSIEELETIIPEDLEDLDQEDLEKIKESEDIDLEGLDLEEVNWEQLNEVSSITRKIYSVLPQSFINFFQSEVEDIENFDIKGDIDSNNKMQKTESELLPESVPSHPNLELQRYEEFSSIPQFILEDITEEYINRETVLLSYETDFPERDKEELKERVEIEKEIPENYIEDKEELLTDYYNFTELINWYKEKLPEKGWELVEEKEESAYFEHNRDGYLLILFYKRILYTPGNKSQKN